MVFRDSVADARYVAGFLNTPLGLALRESLNSGTTIPKLAKKTLQGGSLYLPSREIQVRTVESSATVSTIMSNLKELERDLWEHPRQIDSNIGAVSKYARRDNLTEWIDYLPFSLASILWTYHSVERSPKEAYEHLLHFFEALAEFMATVLLSAFASRPAKRSKQSDPDCRRHWLSQAYRLNEPHLGRGRCFLNILGSEEGRY
jgi:hypothetical protein